MSTSQLPILYSFRRCPYAMRARLAISFAGVSVELREVVLRNKPEQLLAASPKGTVPVLILPDGQVIDESYDIMRWAIHYAPDCDWQTLESQSDIWVTRNDNDFKPWLDRYKYADRYPEHPESVYQQHCLEWFNTLDAQLREQGGFLLDNQMSLADAALLPFVRQCAHVNREWFYQQELPSLQGWLDQFLESSLFKQVMCKYPQWHPDDAPTIF